MLLATRLADIPKVSSAALTPADRRQNHSIADSPPYGAAATSLFQLYSGSGQQAAGISGLIRSSGLNSSGSLTPQSYG